MSRPRGSLTSSTLLPTHIHIRVSSELASAMVFGKGFRSKMEKVFSSSAQDPEVVNDPPPPYVLPPEFVEAGVKEDDLAILKDYDTVIILDDSGSMEPLWGQVQSPFLSAPSIEMVVYYWFLFQACRALAMLAVVASRYDRNGIDIHFLNHEKVGERLKVKRFIVRLPHPRIDNRLLTWFYLLVCTRRGTALR